MYAVIFKAKIKALDDAYAKTARRMRELAMSKYGCIDFVVLTEGENEIAISYWESEEDIRRWREDKEHQQAQKLGRDKWYASYRVEVVKVLRGYEKDNRV